MKILFISCHSVWITKGGRENSLKNRITYLSESGYEIDIFYFNHMDDYGKYDDSLKIKEYHCPKMRRCTKYCNVLGTMFSSRPFQSALYLSRKRIKEFKKVIKSSNYDYIFVDMIRLAPLYKHIKKITNAKLILDLDDIISNRYTLDTKNIMGQAEKENRIISKFVNNNFLGKIIIKKEHKRLLKNEKKYALKYDKVTLISNKEKEELSKLLDTKNVMYLPMLISDNAFLMPKQIINKDKLTLGFAGLLKTPANKSSLVYILNDIIPTLNFNFEFKIIGKVDNEFKNKYENDIVHFTGFVDDFQKELSTIDLFLSPMTFGTGIKTKILEAMAAGIPVLTNNVGAEGMNITDGVEAFIKNDTKDIIDALNNKLETKVLADIARSGFNYVKENFSKDVFLENFKKVIED